MLYRASVADVKAGRISRRYGYLVVVMQYYPRYLSKERIDEAVRALAPDRALFTEFKAKERELKDHDAAFAAVSYEARFEVGDPGRVELERLSALARDRDVYLVCQCQATQRCHVDLLLLTARHAFHAKIPYLRQEYPVFSSRL